MIGKLFVRIVITVLHAVGMLVSVKRSFGGKEWGPVGFEPTQF